MIQKERIDRLFKKSKPVIRPFEFYNGDVYSRDLAILWAAHNTGETHFPKGLKKDEFIDFVANL